MKMDEKKMTKNDLISKFQNMLTYNGYLIKNCSQNENIHFFNDFLIQNNTKELILHATIKKISSAFFPNNDNVLRIQVGPINIDSLPENSEKEISLLIGYINYNQKEILAIWNAFYFIGHKKNRSCYLTISDLNETINNGNITSSYSGTPVYITTKERLNVVLEQFIQDNKI